MANPLSSSSSSAWMLVSLLLVFFHTSSCAPLPDELWVQITELNKTVENCSPLCSLNNDNSNNNCHFLNLTKKFKPNQTGDNQEPVCVFPNYFTSGLELYKDLLKVLPGHCKTKHLNFGHLITKLNNIAPTPDLCKWEEKLQPTISPKTLYEVLKERIQRYNTALAMAES